jgi:hypothetical protein
VLEVDDEHGGTVVHIKPVTHRGPMKRILLSASFLVACSSSSSPVTSPSSDDGGPSNTTPDTGYSTPDAGNDQAPPDAGDGPGDSGDCSTARAQLLGSVDSVSMGAVSVLDAAAGVMSLYVDASAGGISGTAADPWTFVNLGTGTRAAVTDASSTTSTAWDLAFKRPVIYTNDGDGGPGQGGALLVSKDFDQVTAGDATSSTLLTESFFGPQCSPSTDPTGAPLTSLSSWYSYDSTTHVLSPAPGTWVIRGGTGTLYKVQIVTYYGTPDGGTGNGDGGTYVLKVGAL